MIYAQESLVDEIIVDNFAGGGGASTGIELATGRRVAIAINHDPDAIRMHRTNHPYTEHLQASVWDVDPVAECRGRPVGLAWFSPDCKHFSKAKGAALVDRKIRGLAWITLRWAAKVRPRVIILENVEEFQTWGPVRKGKPMKKLAGTTFRRFIGQLEALGYTVEFRELVAADFGAPTSRKRFYMVARCDGKPIVWPKPTHSKTGADGLPKWRSAAEIREPVTSAKGNARTFRGGGAYTGGQSHDNSARVERESHGNSENEAGRRNKRSVWSVSTNGFCGAHFAVFPEKLIEPCILAGCPEGGVVLDPFAGSGTTGVVAKRMGRGFVGCELNPSYVEMATGKIAEVE